MELAPELGVWARAERARIEKIRALYRALGLFFIINLIFKFPFRNFP